MNQRQSNPHAFSLRFGSLCGAILLGVFASADAYGQVSSINGIITGPRTYNDVPGSSLTTFFDYPSLVYFNDQNVSAPNGFANRHTWMFSSDGGTSAFRFSNNDIFHAELTLTLTGTPESPRKEAGFLLDTIGGQGQFIVNTDAHEIVAFGGPLPFYAFPSTFLSGDTITLGLTYFKNPEGKNAIIYSANGVNSPAKLFDNLEQGIIDNSTLGGYLQVVNAPGSPNNSASATFQNISISNVVPEPSAITLLGIGALMLIARRRVQS